jgi:hypothetical protein
MKISTTLSGLVLSAVLAVTGCASTQTREPAPSADHPASPRAAETPAPKASATLKEDAAVAGAAPDAAEPAAPQVYTCPHHPKVMQAETGDCPYCGMALVPSTSRQMSPLRGVTPTPPDAAAPAEKPAAGHEGHEGHK